MKHNVASCRILLCLVSHETGGGVTAICFSISTWNSMLFLLMPFSGKSKAEVQRLVHAEKCLKAAKIFFSAVTGFFNESVAPSIGHLESQHDSKYF